MGTEITTISELSDADLDVVAAGWGHSTNQFSAGNLALGIQIAPTVNVAVLSWGVYQSGASQSQLVNAGNIAGMTFV